MATFNGITFEERTVRSLDDARINNALFSDGILTGCALTYSGANLTIAKGALMVKGREIAVDNNETIASTPTYSNGYGRLKYVINLAAAASSSTFTQGATVWQYASTNSFAALTQQDINDGTSTTYEVEICRVKYTSGSITSIESQIRTCNKLSEMVDYIVSDTSETVDGNLWYIRKWKSGRVEMDMPMLVYSNDSALSPGATYGGYYAEVPKTIPFPDYSVAYMHFSTFFTRVGTTMCMFNRDTDGVTQIGMWSPASEALTATGQLFAVSIHTEG